MQRLGQPNQPATADAFKFELEDRIQCLESGRLSYKRSLTNVLAMDIPVDAATNKNELEDFQVCKEWLATQRMVGLSYCTEGLLQPDPRQFLQYCDVQHSAHASLRPDHTSGCNQTAGISLVLQQDSNQHGAGNMVKYCAGAGGKACKAKIRECKRLHPARQCGRDPWSRQAHHSGMT